MATILYKGLGVIDHNGDYIGDAILVEDGVIKGFSRRGYASAREVNGYILPGFVDAHLHVKGLGTSIYGADLRSSRSPEDVARRLASVKGPIAIGRGWDQEAFDKPGLPTRRLLDQAVPDRPAIAVRVCGHMAVVNTRALEETKVWQVHPEHVNRETGLIVEDAVYYAVNRLLALLDERQLVMMGLEDLARYGVVGASSMACSDGEIEALYSIASQRRLPVSVACYANRENYARYLGLEAPGFKVVGVKLFADGSFGARTAALRSDYSDDPGNRGKLLLDSRTIAEIARGVIGKGYRVAVHTIGDRALDEVLDAYETLDPGPLARVEHASMTWESQIRSLASLGVYVVVQPRFRRSDWWLPRRLGDRAGLAYRFKAMLDAGVRLALSTDAPVEDHRPWETMATAMGNCNGRACSIGEDLGFKETLRLYTVEAAKASGGPVSRLGRVEPGAPARLSWTPSDPRSTGWRGPVGPLNG